MLFIIIIIIVLNGYDDSLTLVHINIHKKGYDDKNRDV